MIPFFRQKAGFWIQIMKYGGGGGRIWSRVGPQTFV